MLIYFALVLCIQSHWGACDDRSAARHNNFKFLLAFGEPIDSKEDIIRSFASIRPRDPEEFFGDNHFCSGVVISTRHVLTAAACVLDYKKVMQRPSNIVVVAGWPKRLHFTPYTVKRIRCGKLISHPMYRTSNSHNIALLILERAFQLDESAIILATLPRQRPEPGLQCKLVSFGRIYKNGPLAAEVRSINLTIKADDECKISWKSFHVNDDLCAADEKYHILSPCPGDMGAPLFCDDILYGIATSTENCQKVNATSVFSDVFLHKDWIEEAMKSKSSRIWDKFKLKMALLLLLTRFHCMVF